MMPTPRPTATPPPARSSKLALAPQAAQVLRPDLAIATGDIKLSVPQPRTGQAVEVTATVHNAGNATAKVVTVSFRLLGSDGKVLKSGSTGILGLLTGGSSAAKWSVTMPAGSSWQLEVAAATAGESNTGNNQVSMAIRSPQQLTVRR